MTLPQKAEKEYLTISRTPDGFIVPAAAQHATELQALFQQRHVPCELRQDGQADEATLVFGRGVDVDQAREVLDAYKRAKGS